MKYHFQITCVKRESPLIVGLKAIEDQQTDVKYYSAKEIFELQKKQRSIFSLCVR